MPPPQMADAVLDITHPSKIGVFPLFWHKLDSTSSTASIAGPASFLASTYHCIVSHGSITTPERSPGDFEAVSSIFSEILNRPPNDSFPSLESLETRESRHSVVKVSIFVEHVDHAEIVTFTQSIIIEVVAGGDLDAAGAEFRVDVVIGDDAYPSIAEGSRISLPTKC